MQSWKWTIFSPANWTEHYYVDIGGVSTLNSWVIFIFGSICSVLQSMEATQQGSPREPGKCTFGHKIMESRLPYLSYTTTQLTHCCNASRTC